MNDARDEFRLSRATVKDALYLDENCFSLTRLDMVMETQCCRCSLCHSVSFPHVCIHETSFLEAQVEGKVRLASSTGKAYAPLLWEAPSSCVSQRNADPVAPAWSIKS